MPQPKDKGEKERYIHLNAVYQRIARRDKKALNHKVVDKFLKVCAEGQGAHQGARSFQARILEWVAIPPPEALHKPGIGPAPPRRISCIGRWFLYGWHH